MNSSSLLRDYLRDVRTMSELAVSKRHEALWLEEYPFDLQLLTASRLYRSSRQRFLSLGGTFSPRLSSMMRSLSAQDLFADEIQYTPSFTEIAWFRDHHREVFDPEEQVEGLSRFNEISLFHEQNHRLIWRLLPPPPSEARDVGRYLNFAESLVVMLDLALGDELGAKISSAAERQKVVYRTGRENKWMRSQDAHRRYLLAIQFASYLNLELAHPDDILPAVDYVFPGQKAMNRDAVARSLDINDLFKAVTNPEWQKRNWKTVAKKLRRFHVRTKAKPLCLPRDPLDLEAEFGITLQLLEIFGL